MTLLQKIKLSTHFGKGLYIISLILTLPAIVLVAFYPFILFDFFALKLFSIPFILYLSISLTKGMKIYFYLNLGISRIEYYAIPIVVEFIFFVLGMIISISVGYAIG